MTGKQTMTWSGDADSKLLLAILKVADVKPDFDALTTDVVTCTPRAVQEHLKKLRKIAQGAGGPTAQTPPGKATGKAVATPTGVKKTRKPATGGKGKKGETATNVDDAEDMVGSDDENPTPTKKRKYQATVDDSSDIGEGSIFGSGLTDRTKGKLEEETTA